MISTLEILPYINIASSERGATITNQYRNITAEKLLARFRYPVVGIKDGANFLRAGIKVDDNDKYLSRSNANTEDVARLIIIDCDARIDKSGEIFSGAPDPHKVTEILRVQNIGHILYGSYSNYTASKGSRYRLLLTTTKPYNRNQLASTVEAIISRINSKLDGDLLANAKENSTWGQAWYFPRKPATSTIDTLYYQHLDGNAIEVTEVQKPTVHTRTKRIISPLQTSNDHISPIAAFNQQNSLAELLAYYGYKRVNRSGEYERWLSPESTSGVAGITVKGERFYSHHNDALNTGYWHDSFDLMQARERLTHSQAVKHAAQYT